MKLEEKLCELQKKIAFIFYIHPQFYKTASN
jgi:hypothetical protein